MQERGDRSLPSTIWVAELRVSPATAHKLSAVHKLDAEDVREAVHCVSGLPFSWDDDPDRGLRAIVRVDVGGRRRHVVLYPVDDPMGDVWNLGSAYLV